MNTEHEVKMILGSGRPYEEIADNICKFTTFNKEHILKALKMSGENVSVVYKNLVLMETRGFRR